MKFEVGEKKGKKRKDPAVPRRGGVSSLHPSPLLVLLFCGSVVLRFNGSAVQWFYCSMVRKVD